MAGDVSLTQPETRSTGSTRPGRRSTGSRVNPTRSTGQPGQWSTGSTRQVNPVNGQPGQPDRSTGQPGQRSTGSTRSNPDPVNTAQPCPRAATRFPTRRLFWWRVKARERVFLGNFGTYRFVSKFPTMWYIDLAYLKLLKT